MRFSEKDELLRRTKGGLDVFKHYLGPYSKYGGYNGWDDNTIDEAFDGNPELTWNID